MHPSEAQYIQAKKIVFLVTDTQRGGAETQIQRIASTLSHRGDQELHIIALLSPDNDHHLFSKIPEVHFHSLNMSRGQGRPKDLIRAVRLLREIQPDVLASFCFHANLLGAIAGRLARVPVIISSIRGERFGSPLREQIERSLDRLRLRDVVTTNSDLVAKSLIKRKITSPKRTIVIPNGIRLQDYFRESAPSSLREELSLSEDQFLWLAVGNLRSAKDYPNLLAAFEQLQADIQNARLIIAGAFDQDEVVDELRRHPLVLRGVVQLLGPRSDIPELLEIADAFVLSSAHEGLPNAVMEALATATPVVCTDVGGVRELVEPGISGFVVPPQEPRTLSEAMAEMVLLSLEERRSMGENGKAYIEATFGLDRVVTQWDELFSALLTAKA